MNNVPWKIQKVSEDSFNFDFYLRSVNNGYMGQCQQLGIAEFIVRAVNSHEALLSTMKNVRSYLQGTAQHSNKGLLAEVDGAIAQAEGGK